jgi:hypothetical protein
MVTVMDESFVLFKLCSALDISVILYNVYINRY